MASVIIKVTDFLFYEAMMQKHKKQNPAADQFITQNLYQGAFCLCEGLKISGKLVEGKKISIVFEGESAQERAMAFYNGANVEAKAFSDNYRSLKDFVFER